MRLRDTFKTPSGQIVTDADFPARVPTKPTNTLSNWGSKPPHMPMPSPHPQWRQPSQYTSSSYSRPSPRNIAPLDQTPQGDGAQFHHAPQRDGAQFHHARHRDGAQFHRALNVMVLNSIVPLNMMVHNSIAPLNVMLLHYMIYIKPLYVTVLTMLIHGNYFIIISKLC